MRDLRCDLMCWAHSWGTSGFYAEDILAPGLPPLQVAAALAAAGLPVAEALVTWFAWHDGLRPGAPRAALAPSPYVPMGLAEALRARADLAGAQGPPAPAGGPDAGPWWLPLGRGADGGTLVVGLPADLTRTGPVRHVDPAHPAPGAFLARDLREAVLVWMRAAGHWWWDRDAQAWEFHDLYFPAHLLHPLLDCWGARTGQP